MDVLNRVSPRRFRTLDDLLAFISIYDDKQRTRSYRKLLSDHRDKILGEVCVEGGCGLGIFSIEMARLGARHVYAVEGNKLLAGEARTRIEKLPPSIARRIEVIEEPLQSFRPRERIAVLVHEFYGQLLYDEDLWVLEHLKFKPDLILPDGGELLAGVVSSRAYTDSIVTDDVVRKLKGTLVSGLFEENRSSLKFPVLRWNARRGLSEVRRNIKGLRGNLICFGVSLTHKGKEVCRAGACPNWSFAWTPRLGDEFRFSFRRSGPSMECLFAWV